MLTERHVQNIHVVITRDRKRGREILCFDHGRWQSEAGGSALTLPAKKIAVGSTPPFTGPGDFDRTLAALVSEDFGLSLRGRHPGHRLPPLTLHLVSPTHRIPTSYVIAPVILPLSAGEPEAVRRRLRGEWLAAPDALEHPRLSPTARGVLEALAPAGRARPRPEPPVKREPSAKSREWTDRLAAARDGDVAQLPPLLKELEPVLLRRLRVHESTAALFQIPQDVEDAWADAVRNTLAKLHTFDETKGTADAWLGTLVHNAAVSILRRRGRWQTFPSMSTGEGPRADPFASGRDDPAAAVAREDDRRAAHERIARVLAAAPPPQRKAWELRYIREKTYAEISDELGVPFGTVATWLHRLKRTARGR
jgi:RNA polymerase sigma factor (sigma-70 family)